MKQRLITALILGPVVLGVVLIQSGWPLLILLAIILNLCLIEFERLTSPLSWAKLPWLAGVIPPAMFLVNPKEFSSGYIIPAILSAFTIGLIFAALTVKRQDNKLFQSLSSLWVSAPIMGSIFLHTNSQVGSESIFSINLFALVCVVTWVGDSIAYYAGSSFGKHLLAPTISPKKTWEGFTANLAICISAAAFLAPFFNLPYLKAGIIGLGIGLFGQIGDLFESYIKRSAGVKDSGSLLPGHGGILDRIDSLLFGTCATLAIIYFI